MMSISIMEHLKLDTNTLANPIVDVINHILPRLPITLFVLCAGILVVRFLGWFTRQILKLTAMQVGLRYVLASVIDIVLWLFLTITVLQTLGYTNVVVFFTGSVAAIGLALAAGGSTLLSDIVAGIFLARDGDFNVGDEVIAGDVPTQGVIERIDARRTRIRDRDGVLHIIPNAVVERKEWVLVHKRQELSALGKAVKTARQLRSAAIEKRAAKARESTNL